MSYYDAIEILRRVRNGDKTLSTSTIIRALVLTGDIDDNCGYSTTLRDAAHVSRLGDVHPSSN